jgi:hypothetical protein
MIVKNLHSCLYVSFGNFSRLTQPGTTKNVKRELLLYKLSIKECGIADGSGI